MELPSYVKALLTPRADGLPVVLVSGDLALVITGELLDRDAYRDAYRDRARHEVRIA